MDRARTPAAVWIGCFTDDQGTRGLNHVDLPRATTDEPWHVDASESLANAGWLCALDHPAAEQSCGAEGSAGSGGPVSDDGSVGASGSRLVLVAQHLDQSRLALVRLHEPTESAAASMTLLDAVETRGGAACHVAVDPSGRLAAVAHYTSGSVALVRIADEHLEMLDLLEFTGHSPAVPDRQDGPHAHQVWWLGTDELLVCDLGADLVRRLRVEDDRLVELEPITVPAGFGPRHLVVRGAPGTRRQFAVVGELSGQVACFGFNPDEPCQWQLLALVDGTTRGDAAPSGIILDAGAAGDPDRLLVGQRQVNTLAQLVWHPDGSLTDLVEFDLPGDHPRDLVLVGSAVLVAMQNSNQVLRLAPGEDSCAVTERLDIAAPVSLLPVPGPRSHD